MKENCSKKPEKIVGIKINYFLSNFF